MIIFELISSEHYLDTDFEMDLFVKAKCNLTKPTIYQYFSIWSNHQACAGREIISGEPLPLLAILVDGN